MPETKQNVFKLLRRKCADGPISYRDYIETALYAEKCGYYQRDAERVGRKADRDFYTAESLGKVFAQLVVGASEELLGPERVRQSTFLEIAAEPEQSLLEKASNHPFADNRVLRLGQPIQASGPVVIFANEWLDALPFHRLVFKDGQWRERGVFFQSDELRETILHHPTPEVQAVLQDLPREIEEGYQLDLPLRAEAALADLLAQDWTGLILLFDYGKTLKALLQDCPNGTARTYFRHEAGNDLLDRPGEKDITCDICWTPLETQLKDACLRNITLESQESFLVKRAAKTAEKIVTASAGAFSADRQTLMELIHPANMGQRFQVLWGLKNP
ncbi:SAM-dependent methyltransferase [Coraliomargarita sinensis]|uniref:SAM-dependent methyltransferase n=1 Tax=Coraliomargarita sinensis TaxID=2174842 RepID=UPI001E4230E3|nr:SAM-dependent methyltransferase [Coraliomargarita sinensis]